MVDQGVFVATMIYASVLAWLGLLTLLGVATGEAIRFRRRHASMHHTPLPSPPQAPSARTAALAARRPILS